MLKLLKIEWLKVRNSLSFWLATGFYIIFVSFSHGYAATSRYVMSQYTFPDIWVNIALGNKYLAIFLIIFLVSIVTREFSYKTHRQNIIDGLERSEFVLGKWLFAITYMGFITLFTFLLTLFIGVLLVKSPLSFSGIGALGYSYLQLVYYLTFFFMVGFLLQRERLVLPIIFVYYFLIEGALVPWLEYRYNLDTISIFLPLQIIAPSSEGMLDLIRQKSPTEISAGVKYTLIGGYFILFYLVAFLSMKRRDL